MLSIEEWTKVRRLATSLLKQRGLAKAADILENFGFSMLEGDNDFEDEFTVLNREVTLEEYVACDELKWSSEHKEACRQIAAALGELGHPVRFIGVELIVPSSPQPVPPPKPKLTSAVVDQALQDAEELVNQGKAVSAVDRAHTALHGYLKQTCEDSNLTMPAGDPDIVALIKLVTKNHPKFASVGALHHHHDKVLKAIGVICDALNPIRNQGSLAHANENLIARPEAMLAINASRTILHYVHDRLAGLP